MSDESTEHPGAVDAAPDHGEMARGDAGHGGSRTPLPMPIARFDDPHMQPATRYPVRVERLISIIFVIGILNIAGFGAAYWVNASQWVLAVTFGVGLFALGFGLTAWGKYLMPQGPFVEERHVLASSPEERESMAAALVERTGVVVKRRRMLGGLFAAGSGVFGIVALFPLLRSLGTMPGNTLEVTNWKKGSLLVDSDGRAVSRETLQPGGIMTVFPAGFEYNDQAVAVDQVVVIRVATEGFPNGKGFYSPDGYVAYSKLCTHLGCPVGLYEQQLELLVCPCHQSMFNVAGGPGEPPGKAQPIFGPAPRPLPQLSISFNRDGHLIANGPFDQAVGPGFWERTS
jgi:ubiquinol-cytochrome c reductase iron-sulfur subunit